MAAVSAEGGGRGCAASWRKQVMVGDLPPDFLRIMITPQQAQCAQDAHTARMLQYQQNAIEYGEHQYQHPAAQQPVSLPGAAGAGGQMAGRLSLTIVEARLTKNYGMTRMDPYCRLRIGHAVFETPTAYNGAKNPRWQKSVQCYLPQAVDTIHLEIFDERAFAVDDRIAWTDIVISPDLLNGTATETIDDWFPLSGKQGEEMEGSINVVISFVKGSQPMMPWAPVGLQLQQMPIMSGPAHQPVIVPHAAPAMAFPPVDSVATATALQQQQQQQPPPHQQQQQQQQPVAATKEDIELIREMFPNMEEEAIKSVLEANNGNKEAAINGLLSMQ